MLWRLNYYHITIEFFIVLMTLYYFNVELVIIRVVRMTIYIGWMKLKRHHRHEGETEAGDNQDKMKSSFLNEGLRLKHGRFLSTAVLKQH